MTGQHCCGRCAAFCRPRSPHVTRARLWDSSGRVWAGPEEPGGPGLSGRSGRAPGGDTGGGRQKRTWEQRDSGREAPPMSVTACPRARRTGDQQALPASEHQHPSAWGKRHRHGRGRRSPPGTDLLQETPTFPAWPRCSRPRAKFSSAIGHSALGASALSWSAASTQGAAGKARICRLSFFRAATASFHLGTRARRHRGCRLPRGQT